MNYLVDVFTTLFEIAILFLLVATYLKIRENRKILFSVSFVVFCTLLIILSVFPSLSVLRLVFTMVGGAVITYLCFQSSILFSFILSFGFCVICAAVDIICSMVLVAMKIPVEVAMSPGQPRIYYIILAHFFDFAIISLLIMAKKKNNHLLTWKWLLPVIPVQALSILSCIYMLKPAIENRLPTYDIVLMLCLLYINVALILYIKRVQISEYNRFQAELNQKQYFIQEEYYKKLHESQEETKALWHDLKKYILAIENRSSTADDKAKIIHNLESAMSNIPQYVDVGNDIISSIINHYIHETHDSGITFDLDIQTDSELNIPVTDLYIILGNTIENAIDACLVLEESNRKIKIKMRQQGSILYYSVSNPFYDGAKVHKDSRYHGYGIENVKRTVANNNGTYSNSKEQGVYTAEIRMQCG